MPLSFKQNQQIMPKRTIASISTLPPALKNSAGWPWTEESPNWADKRYNISPWPRISIITPSYNQNSFLEATIRSVLLQRYPNLEYIIMDGGSTDGSINTINKYKPWLSHVCIGADGGQAAAIASGFKIASGEILAWLNSDDIYLPGSLFRVAHFFYSHPDYVFLSGDVNYIDENSKYICLEPAIETNLFLTKKSGIHGWRQPGTFWCAEVYNKVGGVDPRFSFCMDRDLFIRICAAGKSACAYGPPMAAFRIHGNQKTQTIRDVLYQENELLLRCYGSTKIFVLLRSFFPILWYLWSRVNKIRRFWHNSFTE